MKAFTALRSHVVPLVRDDIDTDQIIPARFLKVTEKVGLGKVLFADWGYEKDGSPKADFPLHKPQARGAEILLAGVNFGCGSSREHAPWALTDFGFRAIIARSFADIFRGNAIKNGLLPIALADVVHARLVSLVENDAGATVSVDLASQTVTLPDGSQATFPIDGFSKHCLLQGVDELGYLLSFEEKIAAHERSHVA